MATVLYITDRQINKQSTVLSACFLSSVSIMLQVQLHVKISLEHMGSKTVYFFKFQCNN